MTICRNSKVDPVFRKVEKKKKIMAVVLAEAPDQVLYQRML